MRVVLAGCTGFIGRHLVPYLVSRGHECTVLIRDHGSAEPRDFRSIAQLTPYSQMPQEAEAVVNLAGESIIGYWTSAKKKRILDTRVDTTALLVKWMSGLDHKPKVFLSGSAVGFYGNLGDEIVTEATGPDPLQKFRSQVCIPWEHEANLARNFGTRVVNLRTGNVLDPSGGMLAAMVPWLRRMPVILPYSPRGYLPWVSMRDTVGIIEFAMTHESVTGPVNLAATHPATCGEFFRVLGSILHRPVIGSVPDWAVRLGLGDLSQAFLDGQRAVPEKMLAAGYAFRDPDIEAYLRAIIFRTPT